MLDQDRLQRVADEAADLDPEGVLDVVGQPGISRRKLAWQIARGVLAAIPLLGIVLTGVVIDAAELNAAERLGYGLPLLAASFAYSRYGMWRILGLSR